MPNSILSARACVASTTSVASVCAFVCADVAFCSGFGTIFIDPVALSHDTSRQRNWRHRYLITDETGQLPVEIGNEHLAKKADHAIRTLMRHGAHVVETKDARQHLATFLRYKPRGRIIRVPRTGWYEVKRHWVFVLPTETLGNVGNVEIVLDDAITADQYGLHRSGTSDQWRERVAAPLAGNSNVVLGVGTSLAGPLLPWADEPGGGFHSHGFSKAGKTLIGAAAQSILGQAIQAWGRGRCVWLHLGIDGKQARRACCAAVRYRPLLGRDRHGRSESHLPSHLQASRRSG